MHVTESPALPGQNGSMDMVPPVQIRALDAAALASSAAAEVNALLAPRFEGWDAQTVRAAFAHVADAYAGRVPGILPCDTPYHDLRHILETATATARLIDGWERMNGATDSIGAPLAAVSLVLALMHDIGLLRESHEAHLTGAALTVGHEKRGARFARRWLAGTALAAHADLADLIEATRLGCAVESVTDDPKLMLLARLVATADIMVQLADRDYLEKCRDFLYVEFVAAGWARGPDGSNPDAVYASPEDLLAKTPAFARTQVLDRLDGTLGGVNKYFEVHFGGPDPYMAAIRRNLEYLDRLVADGDFSRLRRTPMAVWPERGP